MLTLSIHPDATFVAVSSSGVRASAGANADCVGRVIVNATLALEQDVHDQRMRAREQRDGHDGAGHRLREVAGQEHLSRA